MDRGRFPPTGHNLGLQLPGGAAPRSSWLINGSSGWSRSSYLRPVHYGNRYGRGGIHSVLPHHATANVFRVDKAFRCGLKVFGNSRNGERSPESERIQPRQRHSLLFRAKSLNNTSHSIFPRSYLITRFCDTRLRGIPAGDRTRVRHF